MSSKLQETPSKAATSRKNPSDKLIGKLELQPCNQSRMELGTFTVANPPRGFSVEITPDPVPSDAVVSKVLSTGSGNHYRLVLQLANYGDTPVTAKVCAL